VRGCKPLLARIRKGCCLGFATSVEGRGHTTSHHHLAVAVDGNKWSYLYKALSKALQEAKGVLHLGLPFF
jgi:hypothetical protein